MKRVYYTWDKWECYPAGFYDNKHPRNLDVEECEEEYRQFLSNIKLFEKSMKRVLEEWPNSCEHYMTNEKMNRIAWLGQAAICIYNGTPSRFRGGYNLLTDDQKKAADGVALKFLNKWLDQYGENGLSMDQAQSKTTADLY